MGKRRLKRQLGLLPVVMLGTAGAISAEIFVLTGYAAGLVGPATVLAFIVGGLLSYSVALNYCELATTYPYAGGALTYVREAWGSNLLSFLVGSLDCLSSTFYAAMSAVGFAYSLRVFLPWLPVVPTAVAVVLAFVALNVIGVSKVGDAQVILGGLLLLAFGVYVIAGLLRPGGFHWGVFLSGGRFFIYRDTWTNLAKIMRAIALLYTSYVGFEVIADDAEEVADPDRTIPRGILLSLTLCIVVFVAVATVTLGTIPWQELAGSGTALTDAVRRFLPVWGVPMMAVAGLIATLTSISSAMLSATREAFTLSRDGQWPRFLSRLSRFRTPYAAILSVGAVVCLVAAIGVVDFLSYISSSGYLFVLFWASLAMIRLRKLHAERRRPFQVPLFPLTAYLAAASCFLIVAFTPWRALLFGAGVIALCAMFYYLSPPLARLVRERRRALEQSKDRILIPVANPRTAESLARVATILAQASADTSACVLTVVPVSPRLSGEITQRLVARFAPQQQSLLRHITEQAQARNVPLYTKLRAAPSISQGILMEADSSVKLVMMGWPGTLDSLKLSENPVKAVVQNAHASVAVLLDRGLCNVRHILVPVGGGPHSRLAIRLAYEIAEQEGAQLTTLHCLCQVSEGDELQDRMSLLREIVEDELGSVPSRIITRLVQADSLPAGILNEISRQNYDLLVLGASDEWLTPGYLFGAVDDQVAAQATCSVLLVRRYETATISWIRRKVKL